MSGPRASEPINASAMYVDHVDAIHAYVARRLGRDLAADVTAETFRIALDGIARFDPDRGTPRMWLFGIASNLIRRHRRTEERRLRAMARTATIEGRAESMHDHGQERAVEQLDADRQLRAVLDAVAALDESDRELLMLLAWEEWSHEEIAQMLGVPSGTVRSRLHRIRRELRAAADADGPRVDVQQEETTHG